MKKIISLLVVMVLIASCMALPVSAVISPEVDDVITNVEGKDDNGDDVVIRFDRVDEVDDDMKPDSDKEKVIGQYDVYVEGDPEYPITVTVDVAGVKKGSKVYILAKDEDGSIQYIKVEVVANGKVKFKLDKYYSTISFITDKKTSTQIGESDKTGDVASSTIIVMMLFCLSAAAISLKKIKEN